MEGVTAMQEWEYQEIWLERVKPYTSSKWSGFTATINNIPSSLQEFEDYMQVLGNQGWELVTTVPVAYEARDDARGMTTMLVYIFKRPTFSRKNPPPLIKAKPTRERK